MNSDDGEHFPPSVLAKREEKSSFLRLREHTLTFPVLETDRRGSLFHHSYVRMAGGEEGGEEEE